MHEKVVISPKKQKEIYIDNFIEKHVEEKNKLGKLESLQNEYKKKEVKLPSSLPCSFFFLSQIFLFVVFYISLLVYSIS